MQTYDAYRTALADVPLPAAFADLCPEWETFQRVRREFDPDGRFLNDHLARVFGAGDDATAESTPAAADD